MIIFITMVLVFPSEVYSKNALKKDFKKVGKGFNKMGKGLGKLGKSFNPKMLKKAFTCAINLEKSLVALIKNPRDPVALQKVKSNPCIKTLKTMNKTCSSPAMMAAAEIPNVGQIVGFGCGKVGLADLKAEMVIEKAETLQGIASNPSQMMDDEDMPARPMMPRKPNNPKSVGFKRARPANFSQGGNAGQVSEDDADVDDSGEQ